MNCAKFFVPAIACLSLVSLQAARAQDFWSDYDGADSAQSAIEPSQSGTTVIVPGTVTHIISQESSQIAKMPPAGAAAVAAPKLPPPDLKAVARLAPPQPEPPACPNQKGKPDLQQRAQELQSMIDKAVKCGALTPTQAAGLRAEIKRARLLQVSVLNRVNHRLNTAMARQRAR